MKFELQAAAQFQQLFIKLTLQNVLFGERGSGVGLLVQLIRQQYEAVAHLQLG